MAMAEKPRKGTDLKGAPQTAVRKEELNRRRGTVVRDPERGPENKK